MQKLIGRDMQKAIHTTRETLHYRSRVSVFVNIMSWRHVCLISPELDFERQCNNTLWSPQYKNSTAWQAKYCVSWEQFNLSRTNSPFCLFKTISVFSRRVVVSCPLFFSSQTKFISIDSSLPFLLPLLSFKRRWNTRHGCSLVSSMSQR